MPVIPPQQYPLDVEQGGSVAPTPATRRDEQQPISVTELNRRTRNLIEARFELLWVSGELSNLVRAASGHYYFVLKDNVAQVRCVMFRNRAAALGFKPENGLQVDVRALPSLYEARGEFQLGVEGMRRAGLGALFEAFERLKAKLSAEGLFDAARKRPLPPFPRRVGIVTSLQAAALQDVLTTLNRRAPMIEIIIYPTAVQGANAPQEIAAAIDAAGARAEVEVLVVCRGGGSIEDLWSFNAEVVARAIVRLQNQTEIAVVSGVGHETDFTICDFVADQRAPTPTAAAELISPDAAQMRAAVQASRTVFSRSLRRTMDTAHQRVDRAQRSLLSPQHRIDRERERLGRVTIHLRHALYACVQRAGFATALLRQRMLPHRPDPTLQLAALHKRGTDLRSVIDKVLSAHVSQLLGLAQALQLLAPARVLERGYSIVEHNGVILRDSANVRTGETIAVRLAHGQLTAVVRAEP